MQINELREIGSRLYAAIGKQRIRPFSTQPVRKGAGGDRSFPIDIEAEEIVISALKELGRPMSIISEEFGSLDLHGGGPRIIIDPIDGSKNAISGVPFYCASIGVAADDEIGSMYKGYVINLVTGDEFWAEKGSGAYFNGERIYCQKDDIFYFIAYEAQTPGHDIPRIMPLLGQARRARCFGALALDLCYVAYGSVSVFVGPVPSRSYDFAAGYLLIKEAGGVITDIKGNSIEHSKNGMGERTPILAAGNEKLHEASLRLLYG